MVDAEADTSVYYLTVRAPSFEILHHFVVEEVRVVRFENYYFVVLHVIGSEVVDIRTG